MSFENFWPSVLFEITCGNNLTYSYDRGAASQLPYLAEGNLTTG